MKKLALVGLVLSLGLSACGGDRPAVAPPTINMGKTWVLDLHPTSGSTADNRLRLNLKQNTSSVTGTAEAAGPVGDLYEPYGNVTGGVTDNKFTLNIAAGGNYSGSMTLEGVMVGGNLSGTFIARGANGVASAGTFASR